MPIGTEPEGTTPPTIGQATPGDGSPSMIAVGAWETGEFAAVRQSIDPQCRWPVLPSLAEAESWIAAAPAPPELCFLAQPRPGCDDQAQVDRLRSISPLTRIVVAAGSWCEGELRTGRPLAGVVRLYWHQLPAWWRAAAAQAARGDRPPWSNPLDDVRAGQSIPWNCEQSAPLDGTIAVDAPDFAAYESIAAALSSICAAPCTWRPRHRPEAMPAAELGQPVLGGIWDGGQLDPDEAESLTRFSQGLGPGAVPVVALVDYPRLEHLEIAATAGATLIMGKPYEAYLLCHEVHRLASGAARTGLL